MRAYDSTKKIIEQLVMKSENSRVMEFREIRLPNWFQPARSETHTQTDYHSLQLPGDNVLDVTCRSVSGFSEGSYNFYVNKKLAGRDASEQELEQFVKTLIDNNSKPSF